MKKALLTGATGFIGRHCLPLLHTKGYEVHAVSSESALPAGVSGVHHRVDLLDPIRVGELIADIQPSHLLHLAWYAEPGKYWSSPENMRWVAASIALLEAFSSHGGRRAVMAGTCAEYDWRYGYCSERITPTQPSTLYGICKHALQSMVTAFSERVDLSSAWGRMFFLYGPYEHPSRLVASVVDSLLRGDPALCTHGNQIRDFLHVEDVARALVDLMDSSVRGPVNIASGEPVRLKEIILQIARILNREDLVQLGALTSRAGEPPLLVADIGRLATEVGWKATYDLTEGLKQTIDWRRDRPCRGKP